MALNRIAIPPDAARDARARELVPQVKTWHTGTLKQPWGAFEVGTAYFITHNGYCVNAVRCSCPDYEKNEQICKHVRAVVMADEQAVTKPRKTYEDLFPPCAQPGCAADPESGERYCRSHWLGEFY